MNKKIKEILSLFVASSMIFGSYVPQICAKEDIDSLNVNSANDTWEVQSEDENQGENSENYAEANSQLIVKYIDGDGERINDENAVYINHEYDAVALSEGSDVNEYMEQAKEANDNIDYIQIDYQLRLFNVDETDVFNDETEDSLDEDLSISEDSRDESIIEDRSEVSITVSQETDLENVSQVEVETEYETQDNNTIADADDENIENDINNEIEVGESTDITVALIDSGVYIEHEALSDNIWVNTNEIEDSSDGDGNGYIDDINGWDFADNKPLLYEESRMVDYNHGTHVAGIIASVSESAKIMSLKAFKDGSAYTSDIIRAINYAETMGADIVNCSFGSDNENRALKETIEKSDMVYVCAAGNNAKNIDKSPVYPASYDLENIISVAAVDSNNNLAYFSNYGDNVDIAAPGCSINSSISENEYGMSSGTSVSAGYITGLLSDTMSDNTELKDEIDKQVLLNSVSTENVINMNNVSMNNIHLTMENSANNNIGIDNLSTIYDDFTEIKQISAGGYHSAVLTDQTVNMFGCNDHNQCSGIYYYGEGDFAAPGNELFAVPPPYGTTTDFTVRKISTRGDHTLLLMEDGTVRSLGANGYGQLGVGYVGGEYVTDGYEPTEQVLGLSNIVDIAAGHQFSMALDANGRVYAWGNNKDGQIGINTTYTFFAAPQYVTGISNIESISAGHYHALAKSIDGDVYGWGRAYNGALGNKQNEKYYSPVSLDITGVDKVIGGFDNSFFIKDDKTVYACGFNSRGQLGNGTVIDTKEIIKLPIDNVVDISSNMATVFLKSDGTAYGCGENNYGQLGIGSTSRAVRNITQIPGNYLAISEGGYHTLFLKEDGLYSAGLNHKKQCGFENIETNYLEPTKIESFSVDNSAKEDIFSSSDITVQSDESYIVAITVRDMENIVDKVFTVNYDNTKLSVDDVCAQTWGKDVSVGLVQDTDIEIISVTDSQIKFKTNKTQSPLSGTVNMLRFNAIANGTTTMTITATAE